MYNQAYIFTIFILNGFLTGLLFDFFRILRKSFKTPDIITYIQDIAFWIIAGIVLVFTIFKFNNGELRSYIFIGIILGVSIYMLVFSKIFIKVSVLIINFVKKIISIIIIKPIKIIFKFLKKVILKPIFFMFINLRKILSKFKKLFLKMYKNKKKQEDRKDFA